NNDANGHYLSRCKDTGRKPHPARFPQAVPLFFLKLLTDPGDLALDPFAGSNTTGEAAEAVGRRWVAIERDEQYLEASKFRFEPREPCPPAGADGKRGRKKDPLGGVQQELFHEDEPAA